jgi:hypothetical protein
MGVGAAILAVWIVSSHTTFWRTDFAERSPWEHNICSASVEIPFSWSPKLSPIWNMRSAWCAIVQCDTSSPTFWFHFACKKLKSCSDITDWGCLQGMRIRNKMLQELDSLVNTLWASDIRGFCNSFPLNTNHKVFVTSCHCIVKEYPLVCVCSVMNMFYYLLKIFTGRHDQSEQWNLNTYCTVFLG